MEYLVVLRVMGGLSGFIIGLWAFTLFRKHFIKRREFFFMQISAICLLMVSIYPDSINIVAGMLALDNRQYGRLITLLILSNMLIWFLFIGQRNRDALKSIHFDLLVRRLAVEKYFEKDFQDKTKEITVVIPVLNEAKNLDILLPRMPESIMGHSVGVIIVDDGSEDETLEVVKKHGYSAISNFFNRGGGAALRLGYDIATAAGVKIIVTMDGDGQHMPEEIEQLVTPVLKDESDIVIGSRVLGQREKDSALRWIGIHIFNFVINMLAGTHITDCSSGFRAFRIESLNKVLLIQDQFHTAELIIDASRKGVRITEAPVTIKRRFSGQSKKGTNLSYGLSFFRTVLKTWWR